MDQQNLPLAGEKNVKRLGWRSIELIVRHMASHVEKHLESQAKIHNISKEYLHIIPIARGGLIPATMLSHELGIPIHHVLNVKAYKGTTIRPGGIYFGSKLELSADTLKAAIFIDDIVDTGCTIEFIRKYYPTAVFSALVGKPKGMDRVGYEGLDVLTHLPIVKVPDDVWVEFPWEHIIL